MKIYSLDFTPVSMLTKETPSRQRVELRFDSDRSGHIIIRTIRNGLALPDTEVAILSGEYNTNILLPPPEKTEETTVQVLSMEGETLHTLEMTWKPPRKWELYVMLSSHTDIGLHNSQYIQRYNSAAFIDKAIDLIDSTEELPEESRYHYCMEGTWFWNNYALERNREAADNIVEKYIKPGKLGIAAGLAGNCTQIYGMEELCRSAYLRDSLKKDWDITCETMTMIDNNGLSWSIVEPYAKAGYRNVFWAPNPWNPIPSTIYTKDMSVESGTFTPQSCASGSRCDVRYGSALPMVFYWQAADKTSRLLVWTSTQYGHGGTEFGLTPSYTGEKTKLPYIEMKMSRQLRRLEKKYPYNVWLFAAYGDDEEPSLNIADRIAQWNEKWAWPKLRMVGNLDEPFEKLRAEFDDQIPILSGDITGGWYQLALCTPEILSNKFAVDRALPTAEKLAAIAASANCGYAYPQQSFQRAWYALICNDEHSYGASGYQGRRVYETWMQHRAWIELAEKTAQNEIDSAMSSLASHFRCETPSLLVFNQTTNNRTELIRHKTEEGHIAECLCNMKPLSFNTVPIKDFKKVEISTRQTQEPPVISNDRYELSFNRDGSLKSIKDKSSGRELLKQGAYCANQILYSNDNHDTFQTPENAVFTIEKSRNWTRVTSSSKLSALGADIIQTVTLPEHAGRIDLENRIEPAADMVNTQRYARYIYIAFPFDVENARRIVQLNGCIADADIDRTEHGTDTYMAPREWAAVENGIFGVALVQMDSGLVEFDHIHRDKTDFGASGKGSEIFMYVANDWLQMHTPGGSHINMSFRYSIVTYDGDFKKANIPAIAENLTHPPVQCEMTPGKGKASPKEIFDSMPENLRLLALKRAEDGNGIIARLRETKGEKAALPENMPPFHFCTMDERPLPCSGTADFQPFETKTLRFTGIDIPVRNENPEYRTDGIPEKIGRFYTGLIDSPRAACGAEDGQLYLIWGQNPEKDVTGYEIYRSTDRDFTPSEENLAATVERGPYCVGLYEDTGLDTHRNYFYRVRAVNANGAKGEYSDVFCGTTREVK